MCCFILRSGIYRDFDMSFKGIKKEDCGASLIYEYGSKKYIGNACFLCCIYTSLITNDPDDPALLTLSYSDFLQVGGWGKEKTGKMFDTFYDSIQINKLAAHFDVTILVYTELSPNVVYNDAYNRFGNGGKVIHIVKLYNQAHFNLMKWDDNILSMEEVEKAQKKLERQIKQDRALALQIEATAIQEAKDLEYAKELEEYLIATEKQIIADLVFAKKVAEGLV